MAHQLCQSCGSNQFEQIDGRLYCFVCQSQNISIHHHVSFANEGSGQLGRRVGDQMSSSMLDETIPKIEILDSIDQKSRLIDDFQENLSRSSDLSTIPNDASRCRQPAWSTAELYSYILHLQVETIVKLTEMSKEKQVEFKQCSFCLYLRYLASNGLLETEETLNCQRQEQRRNQMTIFFKEIYNERKIRAERGDLPLLQKDTRRLNLDVLLGLIHCSATLISQPISFRKLLRWINQEALPYYNIKSFLPTSISMTGRDRFNLEKMKIHSETFFSIHREFVRSIVKPYFQRFLFQSEEIFVDLVERFCENFCREVFFPFDEQTRPFFRSLSEKLVAKRNFFSSSFDLELTSIVFVYLLVTIRSIDDSLLDEFLQKNFRDEKSKKIFSFSIWLKNLNALIHLETLGEFKFYGRTSVLVDSTTDNRSQRRFFSSLAKIFDRRFSSNQNENFRSIEEKLNEIRENLIENCQNGSLSYAMRSAEFFQKEFSRFSSLETLVHELSPTNFSLVDKSEVYETIFALINAGVTIKQVEHFYLLHQRFDVASTSNFSLQNFLLTLTNFSSIPFNDEFFRFVSRFLKIFFLDQRLDQFFYGPTALSRRLDSSDNFHSIGRKKFGIDLLPVAFHLKFDQDRPENQ